ncbi:helix-turn-helix domain-containing protein [Stenotrophomonas humi]
MKDIVLLRLAAQIRSMRIERGLSQSALAAAASVNRKTIIELEKGSAGIALGTVVAVLESMGGEFSVVPTSKPTTLELRSLLGLAPPRGTYGHHAPWQEVAEGRRARGPRRLPASVSGATEPSKPKGGE